MTDFFTRPWGIVVLFGAGLVLRLWLARYGAFQGDLDIFRAWSDKLVTEGPGAFYEPGYFADYPPGYLYVLLFLGRLARWFGATTPSNYMLKMPGVLADVALAYVVMILASHVAPRGLAARVPIRPLAAAVVLFSPPFLFLSTIWGQVDSLTAVMVVGAFSLLVVGRRRLLNDAAAVALLTLALATKPQAVFVFPVATLMLLWRYVGPRVDGFEAKRDGALRLLGFAFIALGVWTVVGIPFGMGPVDLVRFYQRAAGNYSYTSVWAFNLWGLAGFWKPDGGAEGVRVLGLAAFPMGLLLFGGGAAALLFAMWRALTRGGLEGRVLAFGGAGISLLSFAVLTRMHERYLFLGVACLAPLVAYKAARRAYIALSGLYLVNLYFPYVLYAEGQGGQAFKIEALFPALYGDVQDSVQKKVLSLVTALLCLAVAWSIGRWLADRPWWPFRRRAEARAHRAESSLRVELKPVGRRGAAIAVLIVVAVLPTRLLGLATPAGMQFDEVYHARAAGEYLAGKEIFEYTHPPLAKEVMALSLRWLSPVGVAEGAGLPDGLTAGLVAGDGRAVAWVSPDAGGGGQIWTGAFGEGCSIALADQTELDFSPRAIAWATAGPIVGGEAPEGPVLARFDGVEEQWRARLPEVPVQVGAVAETYFFIDGDGGLFFVPEGGAVQDIGDGAAAIASDPTTDKLWVSFPATNEVRAYDSSGNSVASVALQQSPGALVLAPDIPRVVVAAADGGAVEGIDPSNENALAGSLDNVNAQFFARVPESDVVWAVDGNRIRIIEALGMTEVGGADLPGTPRAIVGDVDGNRLVAVTDRDDLLCISPHNAFAWRFPAAFLGAVLAGLVFVLALRCFGSILAGVLAAAFVTFEGLTFVLSRVAMIDSYLTAFIVAAWFCALSALYHAGRANGPEQRGGKTAAVMGWLAGAGLFSGFAISSKWTGVYALAGVIGLVAWDVYARRTDGIGGVLPTIPRSLVASGVFLLLLPALVYLLTYMPYFSHGHSLVEWVSLQRDMLDYHSGLEAGHPYSSRWYEWPTGRKAVYFFASSRGADRGEIWTIANPVVLVGGGLAMIAMAYAARRRREAALGVLPWAAAVMFVPWIIVSRALFLYHYMPVIPFLAVALAWWLVSRRGSPRVSSIEIGTVVGAAVLMFAAVFPMLDGWYMQPRYHELVRAWLPWVF